MTRPTLAAALLAGGLLTTQALAAQDSCRTAVEPERYPAHGFTLRMAPQQYRIGGQRFVTNVYNGTFVGPTLTMDPGEHMDLTVLNRMSATDDQPDSVTSWTNAHFHGFAVTPDSNGGDNVTHVHIGRGGDRHYDFLLPRGHSQGMYWYHPHPHGSTGSQVAGGLSGALMVGSILSYFQEYRGVEERTLLMRDMSFNLMSSKRILNVNGRVCSTWHIRPGERQLWHIGNFSANQFVNLKLAGVRWTLLAMDADRVAKPLETDSLWIPPGSRAEVIVTGPPAGTRSALVAAPFVPRNSADVMGVTLGYLVSAGTPRTAPLRAPLGQDRDVLDTVAFLRNAKDVEKHTFRFSFPGQVTAAVNDTIYAPNNLPVNVPWGKVQEWTIVNGSPALHTFHIHQTDMLVMTVNGDSVPFETLRDNVPVGARQVGTDSSGNPIYAGDTVVVRFVFDRIAAGPFVFHCHVLQHEDEGMMHNVCVYDPNDPDGPRKCNEMFSHAGAAHGH
jgi:FtsP/CotA-like multicopper oxidase with cupredoxin domain